MTITHRIDLHFKGSGNFWMTLRANSADGLDELITDAWLAADGHIFTKNPRVTGFRPNDHIICRDGF